MKNAADVFWTDLAEDIKDPRILREYVIESVRIAAIDDMINAIDEARVAAGLSKAALARAINQEPAVIRRLFSAESRNPTLGTLAEVAAALGLRITVEPLAAEDRDFITSPLLEGVVPDREALAARLSRRGSGRVVSV